MSDLDQKAYIFGAVFTLANKLQMLGDKLDPQMTVKQWLFLAGVLRCRGTAPTLSEIAARIGSSRQNIKKMALILERQGFVSMEKDARDARMIRIRLTDACRAYLKGREELELNFIQELFSCFGPSELAAFSRAMKKLEKKVNGMGRNDDEKEA